MISATYLIVSRVRHVAGCDAYDKATTEIDTAHRAAIGLRFFFAEQEAGFVGQQIQDLDV